MEPTTWIGLAAVLIAALQAAFMGWLAYKQSLLKGTADKADQKLDHITVLTNSTLTAANQRIDQLEELIRRLIADRGGADPAKAPTAALEPSNKSIADKEIAERAAKKDP
jgi:hypothetical protein